MAVAILGVVAAFGAGEEQALHILEVREGRPAPHEMMLHYLRGLAEKAFEKRAIAYESLQTPDDIRAYQEKVRRFFLDQLGGFPERTPLNPQVVEAGLREGYRFEKVIYESRPNFYVTAILYLPLSKPPYPGVLVPCGHEATGKAAPAYQRASTLLARNGIAALCYDPIDQGERYTFLKEDGTPALGGTHAHTMTGVSAILLGINTATFRIWDGIRSLDYLVSRKEIDSERIGCSGNSGGGTLTSYLMALDPRIQCAAPSCYLTSFRALLNTIGPQDAEQNIHAQVDFGMEHADYVLLRAPKPTLICAATRDFFDIGGTWDTFREAKRLYARLGFPERVDLVEAPEQHGFTPLLRQGMVRWMRRWLLGVDEPVLDDPDSPVLSQEECRCTPRGQVLLLEGARSAHDLNVELEEELRPLREEFWLATPKDQALETVRQIAGIRPLKELPTAQHEVVGVLEREGCRIEKLVLRTEPGILLPALAFHPLEANSGDACLYLHGEGKSVDAGPGGPIEQLVRQGHLVLAPDLRGIGETEGYPSESESWRVWFGPDWRDFFLGYLLGKSFVGMRAEDILACARFLEAYPERTPGRSIQLVAVGEAGPPAIHAAALEPDLFASVRLQGCIRSWADVVHTPLSRNQLVNAVHGALRTYDLPDLIATLPEGHVTIVNAVDPSGNILEQARTEAAATGAGQ